MRSKPEVPRTTEVPSVSLNRFSLGFRCQLHGRRPQRGNGFTIDVWNLGDACIFRFLLVEFLKWIFGGGRCFSGAQYFCIAIQVFCRTLLNEKIKTIINITAGV